MSVAVNVVGRQAEFQAATAFLELLKGGLTGLVVEGDPGVGKTTLGLAAVDEARRQGIRVLVARPAAPEAQLSYACLADLLGDVDTGVLDLLPHPQRLAIDGVLLRADAPAAP